MIFDATLINPEAFNLFGISVKWYGIAYMVSFILALYYLQFLSRDEKNMNKKFWDDFLVYAVLGILLGGRLGYVFFYNFPIFLQNPLKIFAVWEGGMSFHGGGLGLMYACFLYARKNKMNFLHLFDYLLCAAPIGLFFGRIANFINGELWGMPTNQKWGVLFYGQEVLRHPSQLYEAFFEGIVLFLIMFFLRKTKYVNKYGFLSGVFLICYAFFRGSVEFVRIATTDVGYMFGTDWFTMGMLLSLPMFLIGVALIIISHFHAKTLNLKK